MIEAEVYLTVSPVVVLGKIEEVPEHPQTLSLDVQASMSVGADPDICTIVGEGSVPAGELIITRYGNTLNHSNRKKNKAKSQETGKEVDVLHLFLAWEQQ